MEGVAEKREQPLRVGLTFSFKWGDFQVWWGGLVLRGSSREASVLRVGSGVETVLEGLVVFCLLVCF